MSPSTALARTPGGVVLPGGLTVGDAVPALRGREMVAMVEGGIETAPQTGTDIGGPVVSYQEIVESQPIVGAVLEKIVRNAARVPLVLKQRRSDGDITTVTDPRDELYRLLKRPAPGKGPVALTEWLFRPPLTNGWGVLAKHRGARDHRRPTGLFPCNGRYMHAYRLRGGWVDLWTTNETGRTVGLPASEVIHVGWSADGTAEGQLGVAPLKRLGASVQVDDAARRFAIASLVNAARPGGAFVLPPGVELTDQLKASIRAIIDFWTGVDQVGGTPIVGGGAEWKRFDNNAVEAELVETRRRSLEEVCIVFDTSPVAIGDLKYATQRGNVGEIIADFFANTLGPWFTLCAEALNVQLIDPEPEWQDKGYFVEYDASEFLKGDPKTWAEALEIRVRSGGLTLNDRLRLDGQPTVKDPLADQLLIAGGGQALVPLSQLGIADTTGDDEDLAAAAATDGAMVALFPDADLAARLALDGGDPAEQLHVTLAFLGAAADLTADQREDLEITVRTWAASLGPLEGELAGVGLFTAGPTPVTYLSVDIPALAAARQQLVDDLAQAGVPVDAAHGFTPHMTLAYANRVTDAAELELGPLRFTDAVIAIGDDHQVVPFATEDT